MVSCPRAEIVATDEVGVYHVWTRCVRRAFLCGVDAHSGKDYEYRRQWIHEFLQQLAGLCGVEVGFHAEMANHLHLILRARPDVVAGWSDQDVVRRAMTVERLIKSKTGAMWEAVSDNTVAIEAADANRVAQLRRRLSDISYFMKALCEHFGRRANREDKCSGRFFKGRFQCRQLIDEASILVCGIYVDLNQIRAGEAETPETSTHTSGFDRIQATSQQSGTSKLTRSHQRADVSADWMCELTLQDNAQTDPVELNRPQSDKRASDKGLLSVSIEDYLALLDWTGRQVRAGKRGAIPQHYAPILDRLGVNKTTWMELATEFDQLFGRMVGRASAIAH